MSFNCDVCGSRATTKQNLLKHQKTEACLRVKNINDLNNSVERLTTSNNLLNEQLRTVTLELDTTKSELNSTKLKLDNKNNKLKSLQDKVDDYIKIIEKNLNKNINNQNQSDICNNEDNIENNSNEMTLQVKNNNSFNLFGNLTGKNLVLNNVEIIYRKDDGFINATKLCQAGESRYSYWYQNNKTKKFIDVLSLTVGIPTVNLIKQEQGGNGERHTWVHPQVAINIAQWISPEFDVQVSKWILDLQKQNEEFIDEIQNLRKQNNEMTLQVKNNNSFNLFGNLTGKNLVLNNVEIIYRKDDGFINATKLCQAGESRYSYWYQNNKTKKFIDVLSLTVGIPTVNLIKQEQGGNGERHTWVHPQVAINIAQWISPEFDVQVSKWIYELCITGHVSMDSNKTTKELDDMLKKKYEEQVREVNRLIELEKRYQEEIEELKERENKILNELEEYRNKIQATEVQQNIELRLLNELEETKNELEMIKEEYENKINIKPVEYYINEVCDKFKLTDDVHEYREYNCLYCLYVDKIESVNQNGERKMSYYLKYGESSNIELRMSSHKGTFKNMKIMWIIRANNSNTSENKFKEWLKMNDLLCDYNGMKEIIKIETKEQLFNVKDKLHKIDRENNTTDMKILTLEHNIDIKNEKINGLNEKINGLKDKVECLEKQIKLYEYIIKIKDN